LVGIESGVVSGLSNPNDSSVASLADEPIVRLILDGTVGTDRRTDDGMILPLPLLQAVPDEPRKENREPGGLVTFTGCFGEGVEELAALRYEASGRLCSDPG
jgi:hypothetical protein